MNQIQAIQIQAISGYIIERKLNTLNHYKVIAVLPPGDTYIDTDLHHQEGDYRIKAFNKAGKPIFQNAFAVTKPLIILIIFHLASCQ